MNLEESNRFREQQGKTEQKKKIVLISIILCAILVVLLLVMIMYLQYQDSLKLKMYIDGNQINIGNGLFVEKSETTYVNIKSFSEIMGYTYTKGEYKKYNEDPNSCYIKNNLEVVAMTNESKTFTKYIEVVEGAPELTPEGPYGMEMQVASDNGDSNVYVLEKTIVTIDGQLYMPFEILTDVYNVLVDTSEQNRIRIYTLPELFKNAMKTAAQLEYSNISGIYENIRAIPYGLIVVGSNGIYGVIDSKSGTEILSVKYENLEFIQNVKEFFIRAENTVGLLDKEGQTIIKPMDYDDLSILDEVKQLYLVKKDSKYGVLNRKGEIVVHVDYDDIGFEKISDFKIENIGSTSLLFDKCIVVELDGLYGLFDIEGNELLPTVYEQLGYLTKSTDTSGEESVLLIPEEVGIQGIVFEKDDFYGIYDVKSERIIIPSVYSRIYSITKAGTTTYYMEFGEEQIDIAQYIKDNNLTGEISNSSEDNPNVIINEENGGEDFQTEPVEENQDEGYVEE